MSSRPAATAGARQGLTGYAGSPGNAAGDKYPVAVPDFRGDFIVRIQLLPPGTFS